MYDARALVWALPTAERGSLASTLALICRPFQVVTVVFDAPPVLPSVRDVYNVSLDAEGE